MSENLDITKCKYHTFDGGRDLILCTLEHHPYICEQVEGCYFKQLKACQEENQKMSEDLLQALNENEFLKSSLFSITDPPCRVDCCKDECESYDGCSYIIKKKVFGKDSNAN